MTDESTPYFLIGKVPPGLTVSEVASRLSLSYHQARYRMLKAGYRAKDGRETGQHNHRKFNPKPHEWRLKNADLARRYGVSRERVRKVRELRGIKRLT